MGQVATGKLLNDTGAFTFQTTNHLSTGYLKSGSLHQCLTAQDVVSLPVNSGWTASYKGSTSPGNLIVTMDNITYSKQTTPSTTHYYIDIQSPSSGYTFYTVGDQFYQIIDGNTSTVYSQSANINATTFYYSYSGQTTTIHFDVQNVASITSPYTMLVTIQFMFLLNGSPVMDGLTPYMKFASGGEFAGTWSNGMIKFLIHPYTQNSIANAFTSNAVNQGGITIYFK